MAAKNPQLALRVLYVSNAGRKVVKVVPEGNKVSIGNETWLVRRGCLAPGKGPWDLICVQGRPEAINFWDEAQSPSSEEMDSLAHDNLLEQLRDRARGRKTPAVSWIQLGITLLVVLCVIGSAVKTNGDLKDLRADVKRYHPIDPLTGLPYNSALNPEDSTVVHTGGNAQPGGSG